MGLRRLHAPGLAEYMPKHDACNRLSTDETNETDAAM